MSLPKRNADCHPSRRHVARGLCSTCYSRQQRAANPEAARARSRAAVARYRERNPEKSAAYLKAWKRANPEKVKATSRRSYENKGREYGRRRRADPVIRARILERDRAWHRANPDKSAALAKAKKAKRRGAGRVKSADILAAHALQGGICFWCPEPLGTRYHADHYIPLARGGTSDAFNIVASCPACNLSRGDRLPWEWTRRALR